ncbi:Ribose 5-phosphate isomerase A [Pseudomonas aeruginosa]|nr:Ribose 5-phosphate isomerase A [Pseudomonas aeruginosa]
MFEHRRRFGGLHGSPESTPGPPGGLPARRRKTPRLPVIRGKTGARQAAIIRPFVSQRHRTCRKPAGPPRPRAPSACAAGTAGQAPDRHPG